MRVFFFVCVCVAGTNPAFLGGMESLQESSLVNDLGTIGTRGVDANEAHDLAEDVSKA